MLCSIGYNEIGAKGASALAAVLKETQIQKLECAAAPERSLFCQRPLTWATHTAASASATNHVVEGVELFALT